jgi:hypothetical protein
LSPEGEEQNILRDIQNANCTSKQEDAVAWAAGDLRKSKGKSVWSLEWSERDGLLCFRDRIYVPNDPDLRCRIASQHHDTKVAGHPGRWKTLELISWSYWWPQMSRYIGQYTRTCNICLQTKIQQRRPTGKLHPLPTLESRWDVISVDFVSELPDAHGHDAIMNVVDSIGKQAHFIPTNTTITTLGATSLFLQNVWKLHGLPHNIVSNHGPQFVVEFTREPYRLLGITLSTTTAYHPQADRQTERVNQELEQYLWVFVNECQDNWDELLPMAEFQYNNHVHSGTQQTPFYLDSGQHPRMGFKPAQPASRLETVNQFTDRMRFALTEAKAALEKAQEDMTRYYNQRREPAPEYAPGDKVYLDGSDIWTSQPSKKLAHHFLGPYVVERRVGPNAYYLQLPHSMSRLHPVFPVVKLMPAPADPILGQRSDPPPDPVLVDGEEHYEVEAILNSRVFQ